MAGVAPALDYPQGGIAMTYGGEGIFTDTAGDPIRIWIDYRIKACRTIIKQLQNEGAEMGFHHQEPENQILIISPGTYRLYDAYCHPDWLSAGDRRHYDRAVAEAGENFVEEWRRKVLLKESWVAKCLQAGRFLGQDDAWAGCRVGGPPKVEIVDLGPVSMDIDIDIDIDESNKRPLSPVNISLGSPPAKRANVAVSPVSSAINKTTTAAEPVDPLSGGLPAEEDDLESLFDDTNPVSQAAESSSQAIARANNATQALTIDLSDSSEDEALAVVSKKAKSKRPASSQLAVSSNKNGKRRSITSVDEGEGEEMDFSMLDSGPSSRFQSPPPPLLPPPPPPINGKIFAGLTFWVDLAVKNRGDLLKDIKAAGGKVAAEYTESSHVLIHKYPEQATAWRESIAKYASKGIWFLPPDWAKKSVAEKRRIPEIEHVLPGGIVAADVVRVATQPKPSQTPFMDFEIDTKPISAEDEHGLPVEQLDEMLTKEYNLMSKSGNVSPREMAKRLETKHGVYSITRWKELYKAWKSRTDRFSHLPPIARSIAFTPLEESPLKIKSELPTDPTARTGTRLSKEELEKIFAHEAWRLDKICMGSIKEFSTFLADKYHVYGRSTWGTYFGYWSGGQERWTGQPRQLNGASLSLEQMREGPGTGPEGVREELTVTPSLAIPGAVPNLSKSAIAKALSTHVDLLVEGVVPGVAAMFRNLAELHPEYTTRSWEALYYDWKRGVGRFEEYTERWDGQSPHTVVAEGSVDGPHGTGPLSASNVIPETRSTLAVSASDGPETHGDRQSPQDTRAEDRADETRPVALSGVLAGNAEAISSASQIPKPDDFKKTTSVPGKPRLTPAEMASIIHDYIAASGDEVPTNSRAGYDLTRTHPAYSNYVWENAISAWRNASGKFAQFPRQWDGRSAVEYPPTKDNTVPPAADNGGPADVEATIPRPPPTPVGGSSKMSVEAVAAAVHKYLSPLGNMAPRDRDVSWELELKYPLYSATEWENLIKHWKNATGRFESRPRRWDGRTSIDREPEPSMDPRDADTSVAPPAASTKRTPGLPYTEDEELAMGQFVQHQIGLGIEMKYKSWQTFADVYPYRSAGAWAEQYRKNRDRIHDLARRDGASTSAPQTVTQDERYESSLESDSDPDVKAERSATPPAATQRSSKRKSTEGRASRRTASRTSGPARDSGIGAASDSSDFEQADVAEEPSDSDRSAAPVTTKRSTSGRKPKKQKLVVSKKDYEELAHFIVDNIAEGDVPTSEDFERFREDHPHRSASSWYTIWHRDRYRITLLPLIDGLRRAAAVATSSQSRNTRARPRPNRYTDDEERDMARFIATSVPADRPPKAADWMRFQKTHKKRSAPSWTEHYRVAQDRINALVAEMRAALPPVRLRGSAQHAIELGSEEEEEEEVEDIVPLSTPPRDVRASGSKRAKSVIVIEDDDLDDDDDEF